MARLRKKSSTLIATIAVRTPRPTATLAYTFQPLVDASRLDPEQPVYHRARAVAMRDGYSVELREIWSPAGELLALNQQTFAVIR